MTRLLCLAAALALAGCASMAPMGAFADPKSASIAAKGFHCDTTTWRAEYKAHKEQPVPAGAPLCLVFARFGMSDGDRIEVTGTRVTGYFSWRWGSTSRYEVSAEVDKHDVWRVTSTAMASY